jgi:hypothetical protein
MMENGVKILIYAGEWDMMDGPLTQVPWIKNIEALNKQDPNFWVRARNLYVFTDDFGNTIVGG